MPLTRDFKETIGARAARDPKFRKGLLRNGVESMLAGLPAWPACQLVPQAAILILSSALNSSSEICIRSRKTCPSCRERYPRVVYRTACGC